MDKMINIRSIPLYVKIIFGMLLGVVAGLICVRLGAGAFVSGYVAPFGAIFINLLKMVAVPLVLLSLIKGVTGLGEIKNLSSLGLKTVAIYVGTTVVAISVGVLAVSLLRPGEIFPTEKAIELRELYQGEISARSAAAEEVSEGSPLDLLVDVVPENIVGSLASNGKMLQVIFIALIVGIAMLAIGLKEMEPVIKLVDALNRIVMRIIDYVMMFAPFGVFALMAGLAVDTAGDLSIFAALGLYALTLAAALLILMFLFYPLLIHLFTPIKVRHFMRVAAPVQLLGFSTSSSAATLPITMEQSQKGLGLSPNITSFVLPVGVTINMDGTSCYQAVAAIFIAQVMNIDLSFAQILTIIAVTTISSIGTPGIPSGSVVMLIMVLSSVGIPSEGLALILGIDRPLDMLRTSVNVTGDMAVAAIVEHSEKPRK
ncbi:MAG: dicarboxylate/amino acid:cation symporter [Rikenellaceae bacterium]